MPAGTLQVVHVNSPVRVLAGREPRRAQEGKPAERDEQGLRGNGAVLKGEEMLMPSQLLAEEPCSWLGCVSRLLRPALIQRSWVPINPRTVLARQSSTKANS